MKSLRFGILSTYPPTRCGLATFSASLARALTEQGHGVSVVRVDDGTHAAQDGDANEVLRPGSRPSVRHAAAALATADVAIIQHEFGIYGGPDGQDVIGVMKLVRVPMMVVLHTVLQDASEHQADLLVELCDLAQCVVVMSEAARERLVATYYPVDESKVTVIPHGAELARHVAHGGVPAANPKAQLLTWGLIGPGKGIEYVIEAVAALQQMGQSVTYTVAGMTHPKVLARDGHQYRDRLIELTRNLSISHLVTFDAGYRREAEKTAFIASAELIVLPYDNSEQVTSGVLVESIAAGRAIISTTFPHAVELLASGAGLLVPPYDPRALSVAIRTVTTEPDLMAQMRDAAAALAPTFSWDAVARRYAKVALALLPKPASVKPPGSG